MANSLADYLDHYSMGGQNLSFSMSNDFSKNISSSKPVKYFQEREIPERNFWSLWTQHYKKNLLVQATLFGGVWSGLFYHWFHGTGESIGGGL